ncbi:MAG TPA: hypothetical protein VIQ30_08315 [Pseudonocardia sp.]
MSDLLGGGDTRVYLLENLADPSAPTLAELGAAVDLTPGISNVTFEPDEDTALGHVLPPQRPITFTIDVEIRGVRVMRRNVRRFARDIERWRRNPKRAAMHADYARRRKARQRR